MTKIIYCESPEEYIWSEYLFLENEVTTLYLLKKKYRSLNLSHPEQVAYKNVQAFTDYIKQARAIFSTLSQTSLWVKPLLLYYGMTSLIKAYVLTKDMNYPANTSVLQHGLSTRRKKKAQFRFFQDDIRIQKDGLFPHFAYLLGSPLDSGESFKAEHLLSVVPEIQSTYTCFFGKPSLLPISVQELEGKANWVLPETVLDHFHVTAPSFVSKLNRELPTPAFNLLRANNNKEVLLSCKERYVTHPWVAENTKGELFLWTGKNRYGSPIPEVLAHHMLAFALSMICRYETSLWGELVTSSVSEDTIIIQQLLAIIRRKFPHLILNLIREEKVVVLVQ